jgi:hypothetical protein
VSIAGLDPAQVLIALYNNAKIQGRGILHPRGSSPLTIDQAREVLARPERVDYLHGRVIKVDLRREDIEVYLYDQANGEGKAQRVIENLRSTGSVSEII